MALRYLVGQPAGKMTSAREIADHLHVPYDNVAKALQKFAKIDLVDTAHGVTGGYKLKSELSKYTVLEFVEAMQGPVTIVRCQQHGEECEFVGSCNVMDPLKKLNHQIGNILKNQTLAEFFNIAPTATLSAPAAESIASSNDDFAVWR